MKAIKKLIPAAIVAGFAGAASADVSLYGLIDMSVGKSNLAASGSEIGLHSGGDDGSSQGNSTTRVGVKGNNDLGGGLKANFKFETSGITGEGKVNGNNFFNRQAWFGLSGGFGEVRLGRQDAVSFQVMNQFDFNGVSNGVSAMTFSGAGVYQLDRHARSAQYISPAMGGVTIHAGFTQNDDVPGTDANGHTNGYTNGTWNGNDKDSAAVGATFTAGALVVGAAFSTANTKGGEDFASLAASYDLKVVKVMAGYGDQGDTSKGFNLGVVAPVMGYSVGAIYSNNTETEKTNYELFVNKEFKKNLYGYAEYGFQKLKVGDDKAKSGAVGMIYVF